MTETVNFVSADRRERTWRFDVFIATYQRTLSTLALAQALPQEVLDKSYRRLEEYFPPNVSHGVINIPQEHRRTEHTPILVVDGDEKLFLDKTFVDHVPVQAEAAVMQYPEHGFEDIDLESHLNILTKSRASSTVSSVMPLPTFNHNTLARTDSRCWNITNPSGTELLLAGRPLMRLRKIIAPIARASFNTHEDTHVMQQHRTPFYDVASAIDRSIRNELEAYYEQRRFDLALIKADPDQYRNINLFTEAASRAELVNLNTAADPFAASDEVKLAIKDKNLLILAPDSTPTENTSE